MQSDSPSIKAYFADEFQRSHIIIENTATEDTALPCPYPKTIAIAR